MGKFISFLLFICSIFLCALAPSQYDYSFSIFCGFYYFLCILVYYIFTNKKNYFDFDNLFFISYFFVTLYYPLFMYESDPQRYIIFRYYFNHNTIPLASALSVLGISAYIFGTFLVKKNHIKINQAYKSIPDVNTLPLYILSLISFIIFFISGGYEGLMIQYLGGSEIKTNPVSDYIALFIPVFLYSGILYDFYLMKQKYQKFNFAYLSGLKISIILFLIIAFAATGSRGFALHTIILFIGIFSLLFNPFTKKRFFLAVICGFILFSFIGYFRSSLRNGTEEKYNMADAASDFVINNRNTFVAIQHVSDYGYSYGISMLSPLLAPFPFAQNGAISLFGFKDYQMRSSLLITKDTLGEVGDWGLGTNIIADLYLAFGVFGVAFFMLILGVFVKKSLKYSQYNFNYFICYCILLSYSVYLVRSEYFYFLRYLIWCLFLTNFVRYLALIKKN